MGTNLNIPAILVSNALGFILTLMLFINNNWRLRQRSRENSSLMVLLGCCITSCLFDAVAALCDGQPGTGSIIGITLGNVWLFVSSMTFGTAWLICLASHMNAQLTLSHRVVVILLDCIGILLLIANHFTGCIFNIDDANMYHRGRLYWVFFAMECFFIVDSLVLYLRARIRSGGINTFPVWLFLIPDTMGLVLQSITYGIYTIWPFVSVALGVMMSSMKNELILKDKLTGLWNRFYLDDLYKRLQKNSQSCLICMMLDMNGFKEINDRFGHNQGDRALIDTAQLLLKAVGNNGIVLRYAGDEFIILIRDNGQLPPSQYVQQIRDAFDSFNVQSGSPYRLSASIGCCQLDVKDHSIEELLKEIDTRMYEEKRAFYAANSSPDRRHPDR